jgi:hypothetical protein
VAEPRLRWRAVAGVHPGSDQRSLGRVRTARDPQDAGSNHARYVQLGRRVAGCLGVEFAGRGGLTSVGTSGRTVIIGATRHGSSFTGAG